MKAESLSFLSTCFISISLAITEMMLTNFPSYFQPDEDLFNPDYVEVDRVLDVAVTTDTETREVGNQNPLTAQL